MKLLRAATRDLESPPRPWFWVRTGAVLAYILAISGALLFFPASVLDRFQLPPEAQGHMESDYLSLRLATIAVITPLYLYLAVRRSRLLGYATLAAALIAAGNLIGDYYALYLYAKPEFSVSVHATLFVRVFVVALLFMNFFSVVRNARPKR